MWFNPFMIAILKSPFHGVLSASTMLMTYSGRKSGKHYTVPVNYVDMDGVLWTVSFRSRTWWRNFRGGEPVSLLLRRKEVPARAFLVKDVQDVTAALARLLEKNPAYARYLAIPTGADGKPQAGEVDRAAVSRIMVRFVI